MTTPERTGPWPTSEVVAGRVAELRRRAGMNREQLARACRDLGAQETVTASAVANVETGRPVEGRRRRDVTVEELVLFARALGVPPLLLLFPVDELDKVEVLPGEVRPVWEGAKWFTGEEPMAAWDEDSFSWVVGPDDFDSWRRGAEPLDLLRWHDRYLKEWRADRRKAESARRAAERAGTAQATERLLREVDVHEQHARDVEGPLRLNRDTIRGRGMPLPDLPTDLHHLDEGQSS